MVTFAFTNGNKTDDNKSLMPIIYTHTHTHTHTYTNTHIHTHTYTHTHTHTLRRFFRHCLLQRLLLSRWIQRRARARKTKIKVYNTSPHTPTSPTHPQTFCGKIGTTQHDQPKKQQTSQNNTKGNPKHSHKGGTSPKGQQQHTLKRS